MLTVFNVRPVLAVSSAALWRQSMAEFEPAQWWCFSELSAAPEACALRLSFERSLKPRYESGPHRCCHYTAGGSV
jgi:hypothetical protein